MPFYASVKRQLIPIT